ncbi:hypothetical protein RRG08_056226 [Elysia crispata]|uniref:Uncharacterized protein n=1 Tax=Elysia crispata TaxID=231223 RepID=A0AAE0YLM5_9GAST|nr:hypothetical protein RRG08_056226 [Elysia crispata]
MPDNATKNRVSGGGETEWSSCSPTGHIISIPRPQSNTFQLHRSAMNSQLAFLLVLACLCASTLAGGYGFGVMPFGLGLGGYGMGLGLGGLYGGYGMGLGFGGMYGGYGLGMGFGYPGMYGFGKYY